MRNACLGSEAINELLLAARADLDLQDKEGKTALMCAVEFNHSLEDCAGSNGRGREAGHAVVHRKERAARGEMLRTPLA
jgi:hypothetical protein